MEYIKKGCPVCGKEFSVKACDWRVKHNKTLYCSRKCSYEGRKSGKTINCPVCGKEFYTTRRKTCSVECGRKWKSLHCEHKAYEENGYIVEFKNGYNKKGNVKQHRRIMEEHLGRRLLPDEIVHHKNGDKKDNRIENLVIMKWGEHSSVHRNAEKAAGKHLFGGYHNN